MTDDLAELKERVGQLERYVNLLESRVDGQDWLMKLDTAKRSSAAKRPSSDDGKRAASGEDDPRYKGFDYLLHSILTRQGMHNGDLRTAVRGQEQLRSRFETLGARLDSIVKILHDIESNVQALVRRTEDR
jgi:hypothetical protein